MVVLALRSSLANDFRNRLLGNGLIAVAKTKAVLSYTGIGGRKWLPLMSFSKKQKSKKEKNQTLHYKTVNFLPQPIR